MTVGRTTENRSPRVETTYLAHQGSSEQAHGFCTRDCEGGCRVCDFWFFHPPALENFAISPPRDWNRFVRTDRSVYLNPTDKERRTGGGRLSNR